MRDGHGAILTDLEELLGVRASFEELMGRALAHTDRDHATWGKATIRLAGRCDPAVWAAAEVLRRHPDPLRRLFGAEVLRLTHLFDGRDEDPFAGPAVDIFTDWSAVETDLTVLIEVLVALGEHIDPARRRPCCRTPATPHALVRRAVAQGLNARSSPPAFSDDARRALLRLMADPDPVVRKTACRTVAEERDHDPVFADATADLGEAWRYEWRRDRR
ncbi:hypothetical protein GCM10010215_53410 [Streptomyces virginiae]|uniref:PBS lyase n=1 Tax=Streptomyces virginiae TaxID=1961 RepID=A0ABQ3NMJ8_STRVG|nr:hypothetical protein [Streptomyces virginiae]MBP2342122.1 HEAT repeat protein [Streptomyces virginiae]GGQ22147.1 hypothetical protein GCM10010215_53410 [Streptomyces virginiae]GHI13994.1 hypothetical protein Scinn_34570 [Streptomyces virginiae]